MTTYQALVFAIMSATGVLSVQVAFTAAAVIMVLTGMGPPAVG